MRQPKFDINPILGAIDLLQQVANEAGIGKDLKPEILAITSKAATMWAGSMVSSAKMERPEPTPIPSDGVKRS